MSTAAAPTPTPTSVAPSPPLLTAEQFEARPDPGYPEELLEGRIIPMSPPSRRHGVICAEVVYLLRRFLEDNDIGRVLGNDSGIITRRDPDTVRGADIAFYSYSRLPRDASLAGYGPEVPELVVEVLSPGNRWPEVLTKIGEYLSAGVVAVLILDDDHRTAQVFRLAPPTTVLGPDDLLTFPDLLPGFEAKVGALFG
jgi:Uma2 family endonuclease